MKKYQIPMLAALRLGTLCSLVAIAGCGGGTMGGLVQKVNDTLDSVIAQQKADANQSGAKTNQTKPPAPDWEIYARMLEDEIVMINHLIKNQTSKNLTWRYKERKILLSDKNTGKKLAEIVAAESFVQEVPADALESRHKSLIAAIDALVDWTLFRPEMSHMKVTGTEQQMFELERLVAKSLARTGSGSRLKIVSESGPKPGVGFGSDGPANKTI